MIREITATGKNIEDAKETARMLLGAAEDANITYEILDAGSRGILGVIGVRPAKVTAKMEVAGNDPAQEKSERASQKSDRRHAGERNDRRSRDRRRASDAEKEIPEMPETEATPRDTVIPEADLKMEAIEVAKGEDKSVDFIRDFIENAGLSASVSVYACEDDTRRVVIEGEDASLLIGHHGDTLDSLQYLANLASGKRGTKREERRRLTVDIEGYRRKREETLRALARRKAEQALRTKRNVMLEPMSAYERRIIHSEVQGIAGVSTNSIGSDNSRKVVIYLVKKPAAAQEQPTMEAASDSENA